MVTTVLAGPVEFSPADIAMILAVLAALFLAVTAPGWLLVGWAMGRRARPGAARWGARVGGAMLGLAVSGVVLWSVVGVLDTDGMSEAVLAVLGSWVVCAGLTLVLRPGSGSPPGADASSAPQPEGWGR